MKMVGDGEQRRELRRADTSVSGILYGSPIQFDRPHQFLNSEQSIPLFHPFRPQRIKTQSSRHGSQGSEAVRRSCPVPGGQSNSSQIRLADSRLIEWSPLKMEITNLRIQMASVKNWREPFVRKRAKSSA
ncbi:uncharacterized protein LOC143221692 isoform X1 [Lasioglossum baleicum]|uniref:uncharacterized protein LOC143221692 isoform X1 n=1 Tax=Lasioglossum baleicum TaxID=434251 RepID=UPI003FCE9172